ncbi:uncharacterized protein COX7CL [Drosophila tropicalis]|uniref:uncharacterized protein COX7CL n=1 Tax=Drosophila tropicalis TaxID=46794 RepID=UPI0035ABDE62
MWSVISRMVNKIQGSLPCRFAGGYGGGCPGANLPWSKGMHSPIRFTIFYAILGILGFGSPWLVVRHQMLRDVTLPEPVSEDEAEAVVDENENKK